MNRQVDIEKVRAAFARKRSQQSLQRESLVYQKIDHPYQNKQVEARRFKTPIQSLMQISRNIDDKGFSTQREQSRGLLDLKT